MTVKELIQKARKLRLENVEILDRYSVEEIAGIYNGIGPDRFPEVQFTESNDRFCRNGKTAAFAEYSWYDPRRYLVWNKARQFRNLCELFGWSGWTKPEGVVDE